MARIPRTNQQARTDRADPARRAAYEVVHAVSSRGAYANLMLRSVLRSHDVTGRDAAFATELSHGTLRWQGTYDAVLSRCVDRDLEKLDGEVLDLLRIGCHQLLGMRVPAHAAVATTVDLTRELVGRGASGFVNAVLRKVAERDLDGWITAVAPAYETDPVGFLALRHGHPSWIVAAFRDALDGSLEETAAALAADNEPAPVTLVAWPGSSRVEELGGVAGTRPGRWSPYAAVLDGGHPAEVPAVAERRAGIQDEGSQLVTLALARAGLDGPDARWLDMCAGPGGKAALLAALAAERGARLLAADRSYTRARLVVRTLQGSAGVLGVACADSAGTGVPWHTEAFDRVLVDAPCTGLGSLRRRPEARWRRSPEEVEALQVIQLDLLRTALHSARVGGVVGYVTCSPHAEETRAVTAAVVSGAEYERVDARPYFPEMPALGPGPDVQLWPHRHGTDAMYLSLLRRLR